MLGLAPGASAAFKPLLTATSAPGSYSQASSNDGAAKLELYAPPTYVEELSTKVGAVVGTATANAAAADIRGATVPLEGTIRVAAATTPLATGATAATVGDTARACVGSSTSTLWILTLKGFNQTIPLAIAVQHGLPQQLMLAATPAPGSNRADVSGRLTLARKGVAGRTAASSPAASRSGQPKRTRRARSRRPSRSGKRRRR